MLLAAGAAGPHGLVRRGVAECEQQPADARMLLADALLAVRVSTLMLEARARAGGAAVELGMLGHAHHLTLRRARAPAQAVGVGLDERVSAISVRGDVRPRT